MPKKVPRRVRRSVFGRDPDAYQRARLPYPKRIYEILTTRCGLRPGAAVFEIGPGTGIVTRQLLRLGADPITLVELDPRLARYLAGKIGLRGGRVQISIGPFERTALPVQGFDLGVAASSFHWLPERLALRKVARSLKPGGWWATWNNHHGEGSRPTAFHRAIQPLYREMHGGGMWRQSARSSVARDRADRLRALRSVGKFAHVSREEIRWSVTLSSRRVQELWGTFSEIVTLPAPRRTWFLTELKRIVDTQFDGEVVLPILTPMYTAQRV
jgi:SAM-dependent methyltransferase